MTPARRTTMTLLALTLASTACGGGGGDSSTAAAPATPAASSQTTTSTTTTSASSTPQTQTTTSTTICPGTDLSPTTGLSSCDLIDGKPITDPVVLAKFAAAYALIPGTQKNTDTTLFPTTTSSFFNSYVQLAPTDPLLPLLLTQIDTRATVNLVMGRFQGLTAARIFPCVFQTKDLSLSSGDCDLFSTTIPAWPAPDTFGLSCRMPGTRIPNTQQCKKL